ncbi:hypothetical protein TNCV_711471 [Trichonephila clavipes]|nr:hypothetical protein TNCV_711471 [Trichonephila clavipes]
MIEALTTGSPHSITIVLTAEIESGFVTKDDLVSFCCNPVFSCAAPVHTEASMGGRCQRQHTRSPQSQMSFSQAPSYGSIRHRGL